MEWGLKTSVTSTGKGEGKMRKVLIATLAAAGIGLVGTSGASAAMPNGFTRDAAASEALVQKAGYCYRKHCDYSYGYYHCYRQRYYCSYGY